MEEKRFPGQPYEAHLSSPERLRPALLLQPRMGARHGQPALVIGGAVQSVLVSPGVVLNGYWELMLPLTCPQRALLLGLGGGTIAALLAARCPEVALLGVEHSPEVLALARAHLGLDAIPHLEIVIGDALLVIDQILGPFDYIGLDLYVGGAIATGALGTRFLRTVAARLAPAGNVYVNLIRTRRLTQQIQRLERVFHVLERQEIHDNVVLRCVPSGRGVAGGSISSARETNG